MTSVRRFFSLVMQASKRLAGSLPRVRTPAELPPAMIGPAPSARGLKAIPYDIDEHAKDFSSRYWEPLEAIARMRMREVGVPEDRIGMLDSDNALRLAAFHPYAVGRGRRASRHGPQESGRRHLQTGPV